jgi:MATE family multidrug resistance protein
MAPDVRPFAVTSKSVFSIAVPMTLAFMTTPLLGMADTAIVGQFADAALIGGLAIATLIFALLFGMFNFLRVATTGLRYFGDQSPSLFWQVVCSSHFIR